MDPLYYLHLLEWLELPAGLDTAIFGKVAADSVAAVSTSLHESIVLPKPGLELKCDFSAPHLVVPADCYDRTSFVSYVDFGTVSISSWAFSPFMASNEPLTFNRCQVIFFSFSKGATARAVT